jgi:periplasmic protein CpxP/Spy
VRRRADASIVVAAGAYNREKARGIRKMSRLRCRFVIHAVLAGVLIIGWAPAQARAQARPNAPPPAQNVEANITSLHQKLQITPAQEPQFNTFANVMRENARAEANLPHGPPPNSTAVDDLRAFIQYNEVELAGLKKLLPALEALYAALSPAQKRTADTVFRQGPGG